MFPGLAHHDTGVSLPKLRREIPLGVERRNLLMSAKWSIHSAPCLVAAPPGGFESNMFLMTLNDCRISEHPSYAGGSNNRGSRAEPKGLPHQDEATPLPMMCWPHEVRPSVVSHVMRKLIPNTYMPGERILDSTNAGGQLMVVLQGQIQCAVDTTADAAASADGSLDHVGAGAPFDRVVEGGVQVLSMPPGGVIGEWQVLQSELRSQPRLSAGTAVSVLTVTEDVLAGAMQSDDNVEGNLWWWHAARGAFFLLRDRAPFCTWAPSKLWNWLSTGTHVRVARDQGELVGADSPFVILLHGACRAVPNAYVSPSSTGDGAVKKGRSSSACGLLPQMRGSTAHGSAKTVGATDVGASQKRVFSGPDIIVASSDNTYLFKHDSLVFVPSRDHAAWLPQGWAFPAGKPGSAAVVPEPSKRNYGAVVPAAAAVVAAAAPPSGTPRPTDQEKNDLSA